MTSAKLKRLSYEISTMDLYVDSIVISDVKSSMDFFREIKKILCGFSNCESHVLELNWNEIKRIKYEVENKGIWHFKIRWRKEFLHKTIWPTSIRK